MATNTLSKLFLLVDDYDEAITFYTQKLGFLVLEDTLFPDNHWVVLVPNKSAQLGIALTKAETKPQKMAVGKQAGDGVFYILSTDNFDQQYEHMLKQGVNFLEQPRNEPYGKVVIFEDLYGNKIDLIESVL